MNIIISNANNLPIYEQIYLQIKNCIISGELSEGDALPSIRALAKDLRISVITTKRAYDELEKEGFINTVAGKGCYVSEKNTELIREGNLKQIEEHIRKIIQLAPACSLSAAEIIDMFRVIQKEESFT
ncbi:MAG: GntR family transcriptional regulator [Clostridiaceae bacterium]|nr:GntR family transcriptional regulator [Clostridiaceae bacterium]